MRGPAGELIWIASYPKSGSTWLRLSLAAALNGGSLAGLDQLRHWGIGAGPRARFANFCDVNSSDLLPEEVDCMRAEVIRVISERIDRPLLFKVHDQRWTPSGVDLMPSTGCRALLHPVRDPRDIAVSWAHHLGVGIDRSIALMAEPGHMLADAEKGITVQFAQWVGSWSAHCESWMDDTDLPVLTLRFEDRLQDPHGTLRRALSFARIEASEAILARAVEATAFERLQRMERDDGFAEKPQGGSTRPFFGEGRAGAWRDVLSPAQVARIEADHGTMMARLGYL